MDFYGKKGQQNIDSSGINAKRSMLIFLLYYIVQFLTGLMAGAVISLYFIIFTGNRPDEQEFELLAVKFDPFILLIASILSATFLILFTSHYWRNEISERSPEGFAVHHGSVSQLVTGFFGGLAVALVYAVVISNLFPPDPDTSFGPITELAFSEGFSKYAWLILALLIAPPVEEYIFRGIIFAGFISSFGIYTSAVFTTLLFTIIHISEYVYYPPAMAGILAIGVLTLLLRIRTRALGPPVAAHFGYNFFIALIFLNAVN